MRKINTDKIIRNLKNNGYAILQNYFDEKTCISIIILLNKILKKNHNRKKIISLSRNQVTIKDLIFRDTKKFLKFVDIPIVLDVAKKTFQDDFILDNFIASNSVKFNQSLNERNKKKSIAHMDGLLPITEFNNTTDLVIIICLNEFNKNNGSTRIWPKSHLSGIRINHSKLNKNIEKKYKILEAKFGSIIFLLGQTWHQIRSNLSGDERWGLIIHYKRWWLKPSLDYTKCGKKIFNSLNFNQKKLFGFTSISPKFDFKLKCRKNYKTKRDIINLPKNYKDATNY